jgi:hypothetical protein
MPHQDPPQDNQENSEGQLPAGTPTKPEQDTKGSQENSKGEYEGWPDFKRISFSEKTTMFFALVNLIVLALTAYFIYNQSNVMQVDQRAWLQPVIGNREPSTTSTISFPITITNIGKSTAKNYRVDVVVRRVKNDPLFDFPYKEPFDTQNTGIMYPSEKNGFVASEETFSTDGKTKLLYQLTTDDAKSLVDGTTFIIVYGKITYDDVFGVSHWATFCGFDRPSDKRVYAYRCSTYNDADNN